MRDCPLQRVFQQPRHSEVFSAGLISGDSAGRAAFPGCGFGGGSAVLAFIVPFSSSDKASSCLMMSPLSSFSDLLDSLGLSLSNMANTATATTAPMTTTVIIRAVSSGGAMLVNGNCALPGVEHKGYRGRWLFLFCVMPEWAMNVGSDPCRPAGVRLASELIAPRTDVPGFTMPRVRR